RGGRREPGWERGLGTVSHAQADRVRRGGRQRYDLPGSGQGRQSEAADVASDDPALRDQGRGRAGRDTQVDKAVIACLTQAPLAATGRPGARARSPCTSPTSSRSTSTRSPTGGPSASSRLPSGNPRPTSTRPRTRSSYTWTSRGCT